MKTAKYFGRVAATLEKYRRRATLLTTYNSQISGPGRH